MQKYKIKKISKEISYKVWQKSKNSSVFNNPNFLSFFNGSEFFGAYKGDELFCCWPALIEDSEFKIPDFFYYLGPFWSEKFNKTPNHSKFSLTNDIYNCYIDTFVSIFDLKILALGDYFGTYPHQHYIRYHFVIF